MFTEHERVLHSVLAALSVKIWKIIFSFNFTEIRKNVFSIPVLSSPLPLSSPSPSVSHVPFYVFVSFRFCVQFFPIAFLFVFYFILFNKIDKTHEASEQLNVWCVCECVCVHFISPSYKLYQMIYVYAVHRINNLLTKFIYLHVLCIFLCLVFFSLVFSF